MVSHKVLPPRRGLEGKIAEKLAQLRAAKKRKD
jgi:hypothetical protein